MDETLNKKIHAWIGKCVHKYVDKQFAFPQGDAVALQVCEHCAKPKAVSDPLPDYSDSYEAMGELLEAVLARYHGFKISHNPSGSGWMCLIWDGSRVDQSEVDKTIPVISKSLPMAVALAVGKLIDTEI